MSLTPDQKLVAQAYAEVFGDGRSVRLIFDDLQTAINGMSESAQVGAWRLYGYIQLKASALRRDARKAPPAPSKRSV